MKKPSAKKSMAETKQSKEKFVFIDGEDMWFAHNRNNNPKSAILMGNKITQECTVVANEFNILFPKLAKAPYKSQEASPLNQDGEPKTEFLMLLTIRDRMKASAGSKITNDNWLWRRSLLRRRLNDIAKAHNIITSEEFQKAIYEIATNDKGFEKFIGKWLLNIVCADDASIRLRRLASWTDKIEIIESEGVPPHYQNFFRAVEEAGRIAQGIPTQKAVRTIFEKGLSANQIGAGTEFDTLKIRLGFEWLPAAKRESSRRAK